MGALLRFVAGFVGVVLLVYAVGVYQHGLELGLSASFGSKRVSGKILYVSGYARVGEAKIILDKPVSCKATVYVVTPLGVEEVGVAGEGLERVSWNVSIPWPGLYTFCARFGNCSGPARLVVYQFSKNETPIALAYGVAGALLTAYSMLGGGVGVWRRRSR